VVDEHTRKAQNIAAMVRVWPEVEQAFAERRQPRWTGK
jgi:hypothetical protein